MEVIVARYVNSCLMLNLNSKYASHLKSTLKQKKRKYSRSREFDGAYKQARTAIGLSMPWLLETTLHITPNIFGIKNSKQHHL
jgi:hypothetical protein